MSDILIKNMEIPKSCEECPFFDDIYTRMDDDDTYRCDLIGGLSYWQYAGKAEKDCPLIEVPERKHGEWEAVSEDLIICTSCKCGFLLPYSNRIEEAKEIYGWNYCPNCGADLRGDS